MAKQPESNPPAQAEPGQFIPIDNDSDMPDEFSEAIHELSPVEPPTNQQTVDRETAEAHSPDPQNREAEQKLSRVELIQKLKRWDIQAHQYRSKAEMSGSFLTNLLSARGKVVDAGLVQEAKRYAIRKTEAGDRAEFGVAVRLWIVSMQVDAEMSLTIPNFAAKAQLEDIEARIGLTVAGYNGPLGELMPSPENLSVENFTQYTTAFQKIQAHVFGRTGEQYLAPVWLGYRKGS